MQRDDRVYLQHMLDMARKALALADGKSAEDFEEDEVLRLALRHLLQIVGEAASRVSLQCRTENPEIPRDEIVGSAIVLFTTTWASMRRLFGRPLLTTCLSLFGSSMTS